MAKKSSKTAHVLNLLTNNQNGDGKTEVLESGEAELLKGAPSKTVDPPAASGASAPPKKPAQTFAVENSASDPLSDLLRSELEKKINLSPQQGGTVGDHIYASNYESSIKEGDPMAEDGNQMINVEDQDTYVSVNIVEDLVKTRAPEFVKKMGGCTCYRCVNDIIAMALNILPPKYIVTRKGMLFAKISSYENQYMTDLTSALTKACLVVKDAPRH